jgi:uncharacterized protein YukE
MAITMRDLMSADAAGMRAAAGRWTELVASIDAVVDDLGADLRELPNHWTGNGAAAAEAEGARLRAQIGNAHLYCDAIERNVAYFAGEIETCQGLLRNVVSEAELNGCRIDVDSAVITAPVPLPVDAPSVDAYVQQIQEILDRIDADDRRAEQYLRDNCLDGPDPVPDPGLAPLDRVQLSALPAWAPDGQQDWWESQHPVNREQAINEHPEIIGAAPGLPPAARDAANRILLRREKARLLGREQFLAGGRAELQTEQRLAEIAELERRLGDGYLVSYQPGSGQSAVLTTAATATRPATTARE